jgi:hypothetical protein
MKRKRCRFFRSIIEDSGQEIVEAAVILPLLMMMLLGIFWFGRAYNIYATVTRAANEGAQLAAKPTCATCSSSCSWNGTSFPCDASIISAVNSILQASKLDPNQVAAYTPSPAPVLCPGLTPPAACTGSASTIHICRGVQLNNSNNNPQECGTLVSFQYPYQFYFPFTSLNLQLINLPAAGETRMEY